MDKVTAIIISFLRPQYTTACILSLKKTYPEIKIIVGENGEYNKDLAGLCKEHGIEYVQLPFDSGVCVARNELIKMVQTPYVLVGDDDFYYDENAKVDGMKNILDNVEDIDLVGGRVRQNGEIKNYQGIIEKRHNHFQTYPIDIENQKYEELDGMRYCKADLTFNYFVARTEKVKQVPWDEEIKVAYEHFSWFYDFKVAGGKVVFTPDAIVIHKPEHIARNILNTEENKTYQAYRNRQSDKDRFFSKYKLDYTISMNGQKNYAPNHIVEVRKNDIKHVDFCITTFKRPKAVERLLYSIAEHYPQANVYVADQNERLDREFYKKLRNDLYDIGMTKRVSVEHLPYDCGLSYARNHLVKTTPNKYKLILDDDFVFTKETDIGKMVRILEAHPRAGIVGGMVKQNGHEIHFEFVPEIIKDTIVHTSDGNNWKEFEKIRYKQTGCVLNFALMRRELFDITSWDNGQKVSEHVDFYLQMKKNSYKILYTPDVIVDHPPAERDPDYKEMRQRDEFLKRLFKKYNVTKIKYLNGQVTELLKTGELKKYKEKPHEK